MLSTMQNFDMSKNNTKDKERMNTLEKEDQKFNDVKSKKKMTPYKRDRNRIIYDNELDADDDDFQSEGFVEIDEEIDSQH
jgi:hypothetical protein